MRIKRTLLNILILLFLSAQVIHGQEEYDINGLTMSPKSELMSDFRASYTMLTEGIKKGPKFKKRKQLLEELELFQEDFQKQISKGKVIRDDQLYPRVKSILDDILTANPQIDYVPALYLSRKNEANAYCLVDGSVIVTIGLIHFLQNDAQVASILCHELAHKIKEHSYHDITRSLVESDSKQNKKIVKKLKDQKYNRSESALEHLRTKLYQDAERSRTHEFEADSLGYELFSRTRYMPYEFIEALSLRAQYDTIATITLDKAIYPAVFDREGIEYDSSWLEMEDFSAYNYHDRKEKINRDSIRTHPEDSLRIMAIYEDFDIEQMPRDSVQLDSNYVALRWIARSHQVPSLIHGEYYSPAIYLSLYRIQQDEDIDYYMGQLAYLFKQLYEARKSYKYNRYVENVNPREQDEDYQQLLSFLWNLSLDDLKQISQNL